MKTLPDRVKPNLEILFVGTNPGLKSARIGHYFAGTSNMFWKLLFESGLTENRLTTELDNRIINYGYGLTDVVKRPTRSTTELRRIDANGSRKRLEKIILKNTPKIVAFIGKTGFRYYTGDSYAILKYGKQSFKIGNTEVYLMPSTSGASYADTKYHEKLTWFKKLKRAAKSKN
ncbi:MAG: mismatch-specific DNA-glycosylase [Nitrosarchaeum sp.]|nr:mismatch-specific DNA-glycosylase [Nitrosarchaeum sp.]